MTNWIKDKRCFGVIVDPIRRQTYKEINVALIQILFMSEKTARFYCVNPL